MSDVPTYNGTPGNDNIRGSSSDDNIAGNAGDDVLDGAAGNDFIIGGDGNDVIVGNEGQDTLFGGNGDDVMWGGGYSNLGFPDPDQVRDNLDGGEGNDSFLIGTLDVALGGNGDDRFELEPTGTSAFRASMDGGAGFDFVDFGFINYRATIYLDPTSIPVDGFTVRNIELVALGDFGSRVFGGALSDFVIGGNGVDEIDGGLGEDLLDGGAGNDLLTGGGNSDLLDGGAGVDVAVYAGLYRGYSDVTNARVAGGQEGGVDTLFGIESLRFLDGRMSYDINDLSTVVLRLYDAAFDRGPDAFGLADYTQALASGQTTVQQILDIFEGSAEFQARYGGLNNEQFVREMYRFSLNREGDAGGIAGYVQALDDGVSRATILGIFSESAEHQQIIATQVAQTGLWVQDEATIAIARLYDTVFNRLPDLGGLRDYRAAVDQGFGLQAFADAMVQSPEFLSTYGNLSNQQFVEQIYRFVLDREGDADGVAGYVQALTNGLSRAELVTIFSESPEHRFSYQTTWETQVRKIDAGLYQSATSQTAAPVSELNDGSGAWTRLEPDDRVAGDAMIDFNEQVQDDAFVLPQRYDELVVLPDPFDDILFDAALVQLAAVPLNGDIMLAVYPFDDFGLSVASIDRHDMDAWLQ